MGRAWSPPCLNNALNALMRPRNTIELGIAHWEVGRTIIDGLNVIIKFGTTYNLLFSMALGKRALWLRGGEGGG